MRAADLKIIDSWMNLNGFQTLTADDIFRDEGGYRDTKLATIEQAMLRPETTAGKWFNSNQLDFSLYQSAAYVYYSLLYSETGWANFGPIAQACKGQHVFDVGGTFFSARTLIKRGVESVTIVNVDGPQTEFAKWAANESYYQITVCQDSAIPAGAILCATEYFEHFKHPAEEFARLAKTKPKAIYYANSFCTPAYGHFYPVTIAGEDCFKKRKANILFKRAVQSLDFNVQKLVGFNSRAYVATSMFGGDDDD